MLALLMLVAISALPSPSAQHRQSRDTYRSCRQSERKNDGESSQSCVSLGGRQLSAWVPLLVSISIENQSNLELDPGESWNLNLRSLVSEASKMVQWVKVPASMADDLSSILRIHMVAGENSLLQAVLWSASVHVALHVTPHDKF